MDRSNPSTAQARAVVQELRRHGVRHAVLCPGSRSAALALAFAAAAAAGDLTLHVRIDERSAGFLALGLARASRTPVPIVVTSGTAVANLHPVMVEASESGIALIACTANRPPELWGTGANQTIDQVGLFGPHSRAVISLPLAESSSERTWRAHVARACFMTSSPTPGPVQLDIPAAEPLVPDVGDEFPRTSATHVPPPPEPAASADSEPGVIVVPQLRAAARPLILAGSAARIPATLRHLPTMAEPGAPTPDLPVHPLAVPHLAADCVVVCGRPTLHRSVTRLLSREDIPVIVIADRPGSWFNPGAADIIGPILPNAVPSTPTPVLSPTPQWRAEVEEATARARAAVFAELSATADSPSGLHVAAAVAASLTGADLLMVGASNAIRDLSFVPPTAAQVYANRGAAGIDGTIATATGIALATAQRTVALIGDLTFLHDAGSLLIGPDEPQPADLTIIVANDSGGGIFATLEPGDPRLSTHFERVFATPHSADVRALCRGYGVAYRDVIPSEIPAMLDGPHRGVRVLEVRTQRAGLRAAHRRLQRSAAPPVPSPSPSHTPPRTS